MRDRGDRYWMGQALALARAARGRTHPNPAVGAVLVRSGRLLAGGATRPAGQNHAEIECLRALAGASARGATLYVTLEPCSHHGRTPPCVEAVIAAGIGRVVVAMTDPNPLVGGRGIGLLRAAGIEVVTGVREREAGQVVCEFVHHITSGLPHVTLKYALTLDGRMALDNGDSYWISGEPARAFVQELRRETQAILVGGNTVRRDDPRLDCRIADAEYAPARIIVTGRGIPATARIFQGGGPVHLVTTEAGRSVIDAAVLEQVTLHVLPDLSVPALVAHLGKNGFAAILVEAGPALLGEFVRARAVDRILAFVAPVIAGGSGMQPVPDLGFARMADALRLDGTWRRFGEDICFDGNLRGEKPPAS